MNGLGLGSLWRTSDASEPGEWLPTVKARGSQEVFGKSRKTVTNQEIE